MFHIPYHIPFSSSKQTRFLTTLETQDSSGYILNSKYLKKKKKLMLLSYLQQQIPNASNLSPTFFQLIS